jgi:trk system potassium uptake protein
MEFAPIFKAIGLINFIISSGLAVPMLYALLLKSNDLKAFIISFGISIISGLILTTFIKSERQLTFRDGYALVSFCWIDVGLIGSIPYYFSDSVINFTDAFFESVSGFTTTGASIILDIEGLTPGILLWRSMTQWFGGMGIIVLSLAIFPFLNIGGMSIYKAEVPGPKMEKLTPKIQDTAKVLWVTYFILTLLLTLFLYFAGMTFFEAINHSFTAISTGGFSTLNTSIAGFNSPSIEWILTIFMILAGVNFALHYRFIFQRFKIKEYLRDSEFLFFLLVVTVSIILMSLVIIFKNGGSFQVVLRNVCFTVASILTTTGFGTVDYLLWPVFCQLFLLILMLIGGCAGSTSGGIKAVRILLVLKYMYVNLLKSLQPLLVRNVRLRKTYVDQTVLSGILSFIFMYISVMSLSILLVALDTDDFITAVGSVVACLSNIGPGLGSVGPASNYAHLGSFTKWILIMDMITGRLEVLTVLVLFFPRTWQK